MAKKPGPKADRLKINADWEDAVKRAVTSNPPAKEDKKVRKDEKKA